VDGVSTAFAGVSDWACSARSPWAAPQCSGPAMHGNTVSCRVTSSRSHGTPRSSQVDRIDFVCVQHCNVWTQLWPMWTWDDTSAVLPSCCMVAVHWCQGLAEAVGPASFGASRLGFVPSRVPFIHLCLPGIVVVLGRGGRCALGAHVVYSCAAGRRRRPGRPGLLFTLHPLCSSTFSCSSCCV